MPKWPWIQRTFTFEFPVGKFPDLIERVRGTPARIEERIANVSQKRLTHREGNSWSILQNVGHLLDLGNLPQRRIEQILAGEDVLIAADMSNKKTHQAGHNQRDPAELLAAFRAERQQLVATMEGLNEADWGKSALHPRIKQPMRIVDIAYFDAEHDDYHLARMGELIRATAG
jgi:hypothetical protein